MASEFRDPIHAFIRVSADELLVVDSLPFQRLRDIHQLAMTYMVYPGATHRRFEHSLGVMHVAGQIFDVVTEREHTDDRTRRRLPIGEDDWHRKGSYWRFILRLAALCHDLGHLPFSHGVEALLPEGENHENMTIRLIAGEHLSRIWRQINPSPSSSQIARIATKPKLFPLEPFDDWETILNEVIAGDFFGADRIDYLLRDSYHAGVAYGRFDIHRLIQSLRIIPESDEEGALPRLGIAEGGLRSAEQLLLARYAVFDQIYYHRTRRSFDLHLREFLKAWADTTYGGTLPLDEEPYLRISDVEVMAAMRAAAFDPSAKGHRAAAAIVNRHPHKSVWQSTVAQLKSREAAGREIADALRQAIPELLGMGEATPEQLEKLDLQTAVQLDRERPRKPSQWFPAILRDGRIRSADTLSELLSELPLGSFDHVFVRPDENLLRVAPHWIEQNRSRFETPSAPERGTLGHD